MVSFRIRAMVPSVSIKAKLDLFLQGRGRARIAQAVAGVKSKCGGGRSDALGLVPFDDADQQTALVQAMKEDATRTPAIQEGRRPGSGSKSACLRPVDDVKTQSLAEGVVIQRLPLLVGDFHQDAKQGVAIAGQMDGMRERCPEVIDRCRRHAHAAVMDAVNALALA